MRNIIMLAAALAATPAAAADIALSDAWVRLPAIAGRPAAGYFTVTNKGAPQTIVAVSSPSAKKAELHESMESGGLMKMTPAQAITIGKGQRVKLQPGGKHIMIFGLDPALKPGGSVKLDVKFANGITASVNARAVGTAAEPPAAAMSMDHGHHHQD